MKIIIETEEEKRLDAYFIKANNEQTIHILKKDCEPLNDYLDKIILPIKNELYLPSNQDKLGYIEGLKFSINYLESLKQ